MVLRRAKRFQFLYGAIKGKTFRSAYPAMRARFNSCTVRLKGPAPNSPEGQALFQFLYGAIKGIQTASTDTFRTREFQFLYGAIKGISIPSLLPREIGFNSCTG